MMQLKNKRRGVAEVVAVTLMLFVTVSAAIAGINWYQGFTSNYESKKMQSYTSDISSTLKLLSFKNESGVYKFYIKNLKNGYLVISEISLNNNSCLITNSNVIIQNSVSIINVNCTNYQKVNQIVIKTDFGIIDLKKSLD